MPGYLEQYGVGEEERNRTIIRSVVAVVIVAIVGSLLWYLFKNHHQESVVGNFLADVRSGNYEAAYRAWGCTTPKSCPGYAFDKFKQDWANTGTPNAPDPAVLGIADSESCNNGVLLTVNVNPSRQEKLWVDKGGRDADAISFAPYPICPHKNPWAIMMHRTVGQLRKPLLK